MQEIAEKSKEENELIAKEKNNLELKIVELEEINDYNNKEISNDLDRLRKYIQKFESEQNNNNLI